MKVTFGEIPVGTFFRLRGKTAWQKMRAIHAGLCNAQCIGPKSIGTVNHFNDSRQVYPVLLEEVNDITE